MNIHNFDLNINDCVKKLIKQANKRFPKRCWYMLVTFWNDTDFMIELISNWGDKQDCFSYTKSSNKYEYEKQVPKPEFFAPIEVTK